MRRLIDADVLIHKLKTAIELGHRVDRSVGELKAVLNDLESMPTIDAVPVTRCKDCKWFATCADGYGDCMFQYESKGFVYANDFCSRAERRGEE